MNKILSNDDFNSFQEESNPSLLFYMCNTLLRVAFITPERIVGKICFLKSAKPKAILLLRQVCF